MQNHSKHTRELIRCPQCPKQFGKQPKLDRHLLEDHHATVFIPPGLLSPPHSSSASEQLVSSAVAAALDDANKLFESNPRLPTCQYCNSTKGFKNRKDLAQHFVAKHADIYGMSEAHNVPPPSAPTMSQISTSQNPKKRSAPPLESNQNKRPRMTNDAITTSSNATMADVPPQTTIAAAHTTPSISNTNNKPTKGVPVASKMQHSTAPVSTTQVEPPTQPINAVDPFAARGKTNNNSSNTTNNSSASNATKPTQELASMKLTATKQATPQTEPFEKFTATKLSTKPSADTIAALPNTGKAHRPSAVTQTLQAETPAQPGADSVTPAPVATKEQNTKRRSKDSRLGPKKATTKAKRQSKNTAKGKTNRKTNAKNSAASRSKAADAISLTPASRTVQVTDANSITNRPIDLLSSTDTPGRETASKNAIDLTEDPNSNKAAKASAASKPVVQKTKSEASASTLNSGSKPPITPKKTKAIVSPKTAALGAKKTNEILGSMDAMEPLEKTDFIAPARRCSSAVLALEALPAFVMVRKLLSSTPLDFLDMQDPEHNGN